MQDVMDKAHNTIILSLGEEVLREVGNENIVIGLWKKLKDLYTGKSFTKGFEYKENTLHSSNGRS